ncbi:MTH1187 family thiamine-binding protein [Methanopyrus sp. KOL6]|uniref:MTH1187 family thiamine-binding protein n=1 Tax=Methanopyrus sp. KOL6 TaxID=1937004 RepID=UPI0018DF3620|nr:MTH1187 family thiamine-binding protein [Methanopyrus sp. KOL6]
MAVVMEISFYPIGTGSPSVSDEIAEVVKALKEAGFEPQVGPMSTVVEVETFEDTLEALRIARKAALRAVDRAVFVVKIDERRDKELTAEGKVRSVEQKIQE